jgi:hypothetical protein
LNLKPKIPIIYTVSIEYIAQYFEVPNLGPTAKNHMPSNAAPNHSRCSTNLATASKRFLIATGTGKVTPEIIGI